MTISRKQTEWGGYGVALALIALQVAFLTWRLEFVIGAEAVYRTNVHTGITGFGPWWKMYTLPAIELGLVLLNVLAARFLWRKKGVHRSLLAVHSLVLAMLGTAGVFVLVLMNLAYG